MTDEPRKRSPRSPALSLKEALDRVLAIHEKEGRHAISFDVAAKDMGYKDASSGPARQTLATLRQFGLILLPKQGYVSVTRQVETFKYAPDDSTRRSIVLEFFRTPPVYKTMYAKFPDRLPSDAALKFEFIQMGFVPAAADAEVKLFRKSAEYSGAYQDPAPDGSLGPSPHAEDALGDPTTPDAPPIYNAPSLNVAPSNRNFDRIPIRLGGGRRAVIEIPAPFYEADKAIIKSQVDLILSDDSVETVPLAQREKE